MVRILSVVDAFTRECLALEADVSLGSGRVTRVLDEIITEHGRPESLRSDNGPEFCSRRMLGWAEERKIALVHIQPGRPMQNGHVESFHGRLRDECLNAHWFRTLNDVRVTLAGWRREYNCERPHSSLGYRTPEEFRRAPLVCVPGARSARQPPPLVDLFCCAEPVASGKWLFESQIGKVRQRTFGWNAGPGRMRFTERQKIAPLPLHNAFSAKSIAARRASNQHRNLCRLEVA